MNPQDIAAALRVLRQEPDAARRDFGIDLLLSMLATAQAPLAAPAAAPVKHPAEVTPDPNATRHATLRRLWHAGASIPAIIEAMGEPPMSRAQVYAMRSRLGLPRRTAVFSEEGRAAVGEAIRAHRTVWTDERDALLRRLWADNQSPVQILEAVRALPGRPMSSHGTINKRARELDLPRRTYNHDAALARVRAAHDAYLAENRVWTEERKALLRQFEPGDWKAMLEAVQALDGGPISGWPAVKAQFYTLRRRDSATTSAPEPSAAPPAPEAPAATTSPAPRPFAPSLMKTPERTQLLRDLWLDPTVSIADLFARINALPGPPVSMSARLYGWAETEGLPTRRPAALAMPSPPPPPPPRRAPPEPDIPTPREQARAALRDGLSHHVILRHISITEADLHTLVEEEAALADARAEARRQKAFDMIRDGKADVQITASTGFKLRDIIRFRAELRDADREQAA